MIPFEQLAGWVLDELGDEQAAEVEEHLMACDACSAKATRLLEIPEGVAELARAGRLRHVATPALLARMEAEGLDLRRYDVGPGQTVDCQATASQRYAITHLEAPPGSLADIDRLDIVVTTEDGMVIDRVDDLPFNPTHGAVALAEAGDAIRMLPSMTLRMKLVGTERSGKSREIGVYGLRHRAMD